MHLKVVTEEALDMQMASNIPEYGGTKCIRSAVQQELAMRCPVQSKECSTERTDRKKLATVVLLCWTVRAVLVESGHRWRTGEKQRICAKFSLRSTRPLF